MSWFCRLKLAIRSFLAEAKDWEENSCVEEGAGAVEFDGKSDSVPDPDKELDFQAPPGALWPETGRKSAS